MKTYGRRAVVTGLEITCHRGEIVGLLGPRGAGKTTILHMIMGLLRPSEGRTFADNQEVTAYPMQKRVRIGFGLVPREESLLRKMTVEQNIMTMLEMQPLNERDRRIRCDELLTQIGLERVSKQIALTLSGGEKRRLAIARSLVTNPILLMIDEPFTGLGSGATEDVQKIISDLRDAQVGILIAEQNVLESLNVVDRAYVIFEGRVVTQGTKDFLIRPS